jgi:predicted nucleotidyltransferase component of viral defense system
MTIFEFYADKSKHDELSEMFTYAAQQHKDGLAANFLEKDVWVTEILRLLYDEKLLGDCSVAFKGGTALSKCWSAIERFSEDIDLSIRLVEALNNRLAVYDIEGLYAELEEDSHGEKIDIHFPRVTRGNDDYQLDHVLLEFGGRNRGKPTEFIDVDCYMDSIGEFSTLNLPKAKVTAYQKDYILWEKLTALHQFSTQNSTPNPKRLARHWYDVDCLLTMKFADPLTSEDAMKAVIDMKKNRWASPGVNYEEVLAGGLLLIPVAERLDGIIKDHEDAVKGGMFFTTPDNFTNIVRRLKSVQNDINKHTRTVK